MAYTLTNLQDDIRNYTEVDDSVLSNTILTTIIKNAENRIYRDADSDDNRFYAKYKEYFQQAVELGLIEMVKLGAEAVEINQGGDPEGEDETDGEARDMKERVKIVH